MSKPSVRSTGLRSTLPKSACTRSAQFQVKLQKDFELTFNNFTKIMDGLTINGDKDLIHRLRMNTDTKEERTILFSCIHL